MASGTLAQALSSSNTNTVVYTVPSGKLAIFNMNVLNIGATASIKIAISDTSTPSSAEYIESGLILEPGQVLERTGLIASADKKIIIFSSNSQVSVNVYGYEE